MGIEEMLIAYRSPWQNPFAERLIGSIRRECLDHVTLLGDKHLKRVLGEYFRYYPPVANAASSGSAGTTSKGSLSSTVSPDRSSRKVSRIS